MAADRMVVLLGAGGLSGLQREGRREGVNIAGSPDSLGQQWTGSFPVFIQVFIWPRVLAWILWQASHICGCFSGWSGKTGWVFMMLWVLISNLASSWVSHSISYKDKNSVLHTQMKVTYSESLKCWITNQQTGNVFSNLEVCWSAFTYPKLSTLHICEMICFGFFDLFFLLVF